MSDNSKASTPDEPQSGVVLPSFRELFSEFVVQDEQGPVPSTSSPGSLNKETIPRSSDPGSLPRSRLRTPPSQDPSSPHNRPPQQPNNPSSYGQRASSVALPSEEKKHICSLCNKGFSRLSSLNTHYNSHTGEKPFGCPFPDCGSRFSVKSNMLRHYRTHTATE